MCWLRFGFGPRFLCSSVMRRWTCAVQRANPPNYAWLVDVGQGLSTQNVHQPTVAVATCSENADFPTGAADGETTATNKPQPFPWQLTRIGVRARSHCTRYALRVCVRVRKSTNLKGNATRSNPRENRPADTAWMSTAFLLKTRHLETSVPSDKPTTRRIPIRSGRTNPSCSPQLVICSFKEIRRPKERGVMRPPALCVTLGASRFAFAREGADTLRGDGAARAVRRGSPCCIQRV